MNSTEQTILKFSEWLLEFNEFDDSALVGLGLADPTGMGVVRWRFDRPLPGDEEPIKHWTSFGRLDEIPEWPNESVSRSSRISPSSMGSWADNALQALAERDLPALTDTVVDWLMTARPFVRPNIKFIYLSDSDEWIEIPD